MYFCLWFHWIFLDNCSPSSFLFVVNCLRRWYYPQVWICFHSSLLSFIFHQREPWCSVFLCIFLPQSKTKIFPKLGFCLVPGIPKNINNMNSLVLFSLVCWMNLHYNEEISEGHCFYWESYFLFVGFVPHLSVLRAYSWFCYSEITSDRFRTIWGIGNWIQVGFMQGKHLSHFTISLAQ